ncbi:MAG: ferrous iron transport protein A [Candidatus Omnitrophica bacterium]|nr:ferrous iron transport protein A [Candidatus Omnitrophota bacterium]
MKGLSVFNLLKKKKASIPAEGSKPLCEVCAGERVLVECLQGDSSECQRLREMGFCENAQVEMIAQNTAFICKVCDSKIIISEGLAQNIIVGQCPKPGEGEMPENLTIKRLSELTAGQSGKVYDFLEENDTCARLEEMGLTPGEKIEVVRFAPLGDPVEIRIRGYLLSLRREEAELIQVNITG